MIEQTTEEDIKRTNATLSAKEAWFKRVLGTAGDTAEWRWALDYPIDFLVEQARTADLVVLKRRSHTASHAHLLDPAGTMLRMGRPTLSVPESVTELSADHIVVGWKDTREARLAVRDAMPFLARASQVTIALHAVQCQHEIRAHTSEPDGGYLVRLASELGADL